MKRIVGHQIHLILPGYTYRSIRRQFARIRGRSARTRAGVKALFYQIAQTAMVITIFVEHVVVEHLIDL